MSPYNCTLCNNYFESSTKLSNHNYDVHVSALKVSFENETLLIRRADRKFTCPKCPGKLSTPTTLNRHLIKMHNGRCSSLTKRERNPIYRRNNGIIDYDPNNDTTATTATTVSNTNSTNINTTTNTNNNNTNNNNAEEDAESVNGRLPRIRIPRLDMNGRGFSSSSTANASLSEYNKSILTAINTIDCPEPDKKKSLLLCELGELHPIIFTNEHGEEYHFLTSQATINRMISDQSNGARIRRA